jgi:hypothetical protein
MSSTRRTTGDSSISSRSRIGTGRTTVIRARTVSGRRTGVSDPANWRNNSKLVKIANGAYGAVYYHRDPVFAGYVLKQSIKENTCREWNVEYQKLTAVRQRLQQHLPGMLLDEYVSIVFHEEYWMNKTAQRNSCNTLMRRVYNHVLPESALPIHAKFQIESLNHKDASRGFDVGSKQLKDKLGVMPYHVHHLGRLIAAIHFVGMNDAWDTEVLVGKTKDAVVWKLFVIDFDLTNELNDQMKPGDIVSRLGQSLTQSYYPKPGMRWYDEFKGGYLMLADTCPPLGNMHPAQLARKAIAHAEGLHSQFPDGLF